MRETFRIHNGERLMTKKESIGFAVEVFKDVAGHKPENQSEAVIYYHQNEGFGISIKMMNEVLEGKVFYDDWVYCYYEQQSFFGATITLDFNEM